ncbi:hypothetical protein MHTCC0001_28760 [Flavobacteriaceae bacterium MHTCC 0001]
MKKKSSFGHSRRKFLKTSSIFTAGSISFPNIISSSIHDLFSFDDIAPITPNFSLDILRSTDQLYLQFSFYNASINGNYIFKDRVNEEAFVYVQLPPQHIAEELVTNINDLSRKKTFLSKPSVIALRWNPEIKRIFISEENLLNWNDIFQVITLDDFLKKVTSTNEQNETLSYRTDAKDTLITLKQQNFIENPLVINPNSNQQRWPISRFETPYMMHLSPIAPPLLDDEIEDDPRALGTFEFLSNATEELYRKKKESITKVWENELYFSSIDGQVSSPRFKVLQYEPKELEDCNQTVELLPAPIHRQELHHLTMLPSAKRDVISRYFKVSSLGASTHLNYKNGKPIKGTAIVGWEQNIKYARDNEVSITFRAVDVFTTLKVLVSIKAERKFSDGKSYLLKRYFIEYLEKEKEYTTPVTIGSMVFKKIIPQSQGKYFSPVQVTNDASSYYVIKECDDQANCNYAPAYDLIFEYIGIDKGGKSHRFTSKLIFIPAESYEITSGTFQIKNNQGIVVDQHATGATKIVKIQNIGFLNPRNNTLFEDDPGMDQISDCGDTSYKFKLVSNFKKKSRVYDTISKTAKEIYSGDLNLHFAIEINDEFTYAEMNSLKKIEGDKVRATSENTTFQTKEMLIFSEPNKTLYDVNGDAKDKDPFLNTFPLVPFLHHAKVRISQIDQIEGESSYRSVGLADSYYKNEALRKTDFDRDSNPARLLFKLVNENPNLYDAGANGVMIPINQEEELPLKNFFSNNYKKAGGMVNPGITISHVSALDQGISYNETHNKSFAKILKRNSKAKFTAKTGSIFTKFEAEICGISLLDIIADSLPVEDIPEFNFLKDAKDTYERVENLIDEAKDLFETWKNEYDQKKQEIERYVSLVQNLDKKLSALAKKEIRVAVESFVNQYQIVEKLEKQKQFVVNQFQSKIAPYIQKLAEIEKEIYQKKNIVTARVKDIENKVKSLAQKLDSEIEETLDNYSELLWLYQIKETELTDEELKEIVKIILLRQLLSNPDALQFMYDFMKAYEGIRIEVLEKKEEYIVRYEAVRGALYEVSNFCHQYIKDKEAYIKKQVDNKLNELTITYGAELKFWFKDTFSNVFQKWIGPVESLLKTYEHYRSLYALFRSEQYKLLISQLNSDIDIEEELNDLEKSLISEMKSVVSKIEVSPEYAKAHEKVKALKKTIDSEIIAKGEDILSEYETYREVYEREVSKLIDAKVSFERLIDSELEILNAQYLSTKAKLKKAERDLNNYGKELLQRLDKQVQEEIDTLKSAVKGSEAYKNATEAIARIQALKNKLQEASKQQLNYQFSTRKFRQASLGVIDFSPSKNTELTVDVQYNLELDISRFDRPPSIVKQSYATKSNLQDFNLTFLRLITIDFEKVAFVSGSEIKDDFHVAIRNVEFVGVLSFVQALQERLKNIDQNLIFTINSTGVSVGYHLPIPDVTSGAFNYFNLNLAALLTLPFDPKKSLQLRFGLGSPYSKFGMTYTIFGGQGYFNIIVEPKRGVVGMEVVLEFGAIFNLNLGVARGTAYLVGGIFIKKYNKEYDIRGYILCVGRFNVVGLFSASMTFYLGLEGNGNNLNGSCVVTVSKRFSRFFKVSVSCRMSKNISGSKSRNNNKSPELEAQVKAAGLKFIEGNTSLFNIVNRDGLSQLYMTFLDEIEDRGKNYELELIDSQKNTIPFKKTVLKNEGCFGTIISFSLDVSRIPAKTDAYTIALNESDAVTRVRIAKRLIHNISIHDPKDVSTKKVSSCHKKEIVNDKAYYAAYYSL